MKIEIEEEQIVPVGGLVFLGKSGVMSLIWSPTAGVIAVYIYASHIITNIYKILLCTRREECKPEQLGLEQVPEVENHLSQFPGTFCWLGWIEKLERSPSPWDSSLRSPLLSTVFVTLEFAGPMSLPAPSKESGTPIFRQCGS